MEVLDPVSYQDGSRLVYRGKVDHGVTDEVGGS